MKLLPKLAKLFVQAVIFVGIVWLLRPWTDSLREDGSFLIAFFLPVIAYLVLFLLLMLVALVILRLLPYVSEEARQKFEKHGFRYWLVSTPNGDQDEHEK